MIYRWRSGRKTWKDWSECDERQIEASFFSSSCFLFRHSPNGTKYKYSKIDRPWWYPHCVVWISVFWYSYNFNLFIVEYYIYIYICLVSGENLCSQGAWYSYDFGSCLVWDRLSPSLTLVALVGRLRSYFIPPWLIKRDRSKRSVFYLSLENYWLRLTGYLLEVPSESAN